MDITLTLINRSHNTDNLQIAIFQKPVPLASSTQQQQGQGQQQQQRMQQQEQTGTMATAANDLPETVAWRVIDCAPGQSYTFKFPISLFAGATDAYGNDTEKQPVMNGQKWKIALSPSGYLLSLDNYAASPNEIDIQNQLHGSAVAKIFRDGKLLALKSLAPQQTAAFAFNTYIWAGVIPGVEEGQVMNAAAIAEATTEISLLGITKADLIVSGGGSGSDATPIIFTINATA